MRDNENRRAEMFALTLMELILIKSVSLSGTRRIKLVFSRGDENKQISTVMVMMMQGTLVIEPESYLTMVRALSSNRWPDQQRTLNVRLANINVLTAGHLAQQLASLVDRIQLY